MLDTEQARAYAAADFDQPHSMFIELFRKTFDAAAHGSSVLDLGCGPGDITFRFARAWPQCRVDGVDGSDAMLLHAEKLQGQEDSLKGRVRFFKGTLPDVELPRRHYDIIISNSLLHHLHDPAVLWQTVKAFGVPGSSIFIMDLKRPASLAEAARLRDTYAEGEPEVLQRDFYNSLLAAFTVVELRSQLRDAGLAGLAVNSVSDRHILISGRLPG